VKTCDFCSEISTPQFATHWFRTTNRVGKELVVAYCDDCSEARYLRNHTEMTPEEILAYEIHES